MWKNILKLLGKSAKSTTSTVGKSMEFIDDILEKEYIINAVDSAKEATGKVVENAGNVYQKSKDLVQDNVDLEVMKGKLGEVIEKGKDIGENLKENMLEQSDTMRNVMDEAEKIKDKVFGDEEE